MLLILILLIRFRMWHKEQSQTEEGVKEKNSSVIGGQKTEENLLEVFQRTFLRIIPGTRLTDRISNSRLYEKYGSIPLSRDIIKQFVATNCSERPGSIVKETLKNGILMLNDTSKELDFHADFKYINYIKFNLFHQELRA